MSEYIVRASKLILLLRQLPAEIVHKASCTLRPMAVRKNRKHMCPVPGVLQCYSTDRKQESRRMTDALLIEYDTIRAILFFRHRDISAET